MGDLGPSNTCFLGPARVHNPNIISIGSAVFAQLMAECCYTLQQAAPFPLIITPSHGGSGPASNTIALPIRAHNPNGISIESAVFAQITAECPYTLQLDAPCPPSKLPLRMGVCGPLSNTWFPGPTRVLNPNGILIASAIFSRLTSVAD